MKTNNLRVNFLLSSIHEQLDELNDYFRNIDFAEEVQDELHSTFDKLFLALENTPSKSERKGFITPSEDEKKIIQEIIENLFLENQLQKISNILKFLKKKFKDPVNLEMDKTRNDIWNILQKHISIHPELDTTDFYNELVSTENINRERIQELIRKYTPSPELEIY